MSYRLHAGVSIPQHWNSSVIITPTVIEDAINEFEVFDPGMDEIQDDGMLGDDETDRSGAHYSDMDWPDEVEGSGDDEEQEDYSE